MFDCTEGTLRKLVVSIAMLVSLVSAGASYAQTPAATPGPVLSAYQELFSLSQKEKRGLMFYVRGQSIGGAVTKVIGSDAVEIRNQQYGRIVIRIDQIDAVAIN
jgi:hypothetical protein